jgi:hypothetical protein
MNAKANTVGRWVSSLFALTLAAMLSGCATAPKAAEPGNLYHIGLIWLKEPGNREQRQKIVAAAHAFAREIPEVRFLTVGQTLPNPASSYVDSSFDLCLIMQFSDQAAMERYNQHPVHRKAAQDAFLPLSRKILFYDFTSE